MDFEAVWDDLRETCTSLEPDEWLVTPATDREFRIEAVSEDRIVVRYRERGEERSLWRNQFEALIDRLEERPDGLALDDLPVGVEPYVSMLTLSPEYAVVDETLRRTPEPSPESPFLREVAVERTDAKRVHDDALLLVDLLGAQDFADPEALDVDDLVDRYVLLSDVETGATAHRRDVSDELLDRMTDEREHARFGTVTRTTRSYRRVADEDTVFEALDDHGIPREWVRGVDPDKLDIVLAVTDLDEEEVYEFEEQTYVQKTEVDESEKRSRLQGLKDRLALLESEEAAELRYEIEDLEERLDELLASP